MCGIPHLFLRISALADDVRDPCDDGTREANCVDHHFSNCSLDKPAAEQTSSIESPAPSFLSSDLSFIFTSISGLGLIPCHLLASMFRFFISGQADLLMYLLRERYIRIKRYCLYIGGRKRKSEYTYCNFTQRFKCLSV